MKIEIIKSDVNNPVAEFFLTSTRSTPETDAFAIKLKTLCGEKYWVPVDIARKLERERDEAREALMKIEDLFLDGTDIYADRENMGLIAREALDERAQARIETK